MAEEREAYRLLITVRIHRYGAERERERESESERGRGRTVVATGMYMWANS